MMTGIARLLAIVVGVLGMSVAVGDFDGSDPLMCSFGKVLECNAENSKCHVVANATVDAADFVKLDFRKKTIVSVSAGEDSPPDDIDNVVDLANYLVVQGVQGGSANDTLAWSMSISHETGQMVVTGAGEKAGFVVFGACAPMD